MPLFGISISWYSQPMHSNRAYSLIRDIRVSLQRGHMTPSGHRSLSTYTCRKLTPNPGVSVG